MPQVGRVIAASPVEVEESPYSIEQDAEEISARRKVRDRATETNRAPSGTQG